MMLKFCPQCDTMRQSHVETRVESYPVRGEQITIEAQVLICSFCGEDIFDKPLDSVNLQKVYATYRANHGLLSPDDIREIRARYGLSQRGMSRFLGWGEVTLHRYEAGGLPDRVHNDLLKIISTNEGMVRYLQERGSDLPHEEAETVQDTLLLREQRISLKTVFETLQAFYGASAITGYRFIDMTRLENMVLFFAEGGVWKTKLNKLLWYADFVAFRRNTCSISGLAYQRDQFGPVPFRFFTMLDALVEENLIDLNEVIENTFEGTLISPKRTADLSVFSASEYNVLKHIRDRFSKLTSTAISYASHDERGWFETPQGQLISYQYALELSIQ